MSAAAPPPAAGARLQVVYLVGSSHSGSTLLAFLMDQHPRIASVGETAVKRRIRWEGRAAAQQCSCGALIEDCVFWQAIFAETDRLGTPVDGRNWQTDYRFDHPWLDALLTRETSSMWTRSIRHAAMRRLPLLASRTSRVDRTNVAFIRAVLRQRQASVFFDTSKLLTRLSYLREVPDIDLKIVWLVRDARAVAASAKRRGGSVDDAATVWLNDQVTIERTLAVGEGTPRLRVRYEDLCADPGATLARLWEFCGVDAVPPSSEIRARDHHILGNSMRMGDTIRVRLDDAWRSRLGDEDERRVLAVAGGLNGQLGYGPA